MIKTLINDNKGPNPTSEQSTKVHETYCQTTKNWVHTQKVYFSE